MDRDGSQLHQLIPGTGWDPTWSPDGSQVLFASDRDGSIQLYRVSLDGSGLQRISSLPAIRGRSDWSSQGWVATYSGDAWHREVYLMRSDGSELHQVSPPGGNSQGPTFSPDGMWIAFTAYFDKPNDINGCEIYVTRVDGTGLLRLTNNDYCDYQPRWGP
jgi:Tol biopolymer transport system component